MARDCGYVASVLMRHLCDHDWHGYTQGDGRWGDGEGYCYVEVNGETFQLAQGDRDCSSAVISCWREALRGTAYEGCLDAATYTGNMRQVFADSGLFEVWDTGSTTACIGDVYLNDADHTAMCVDDGSGELGYDALAEFSISENGTIYGETGDQTGSESSVHGYYDFPWDCTLHYNGAANGDCGNDSGNSGSEGGSGCATHLYDGNATDAQRWYVSRDEEGYITLTSVSCGKCLDVQNSDGSCGTPVWVYTPNGTDAQKWWMERYEDRDYQPAEAAPVLLAPKVNLDLRLDCKDGGTEAGTGIQVWEANGSEAQKWTIADHGDGTWTLINVGGSRCLDVDGGGC